MGALFLGAGSIESKPEEPAPEAKRGFFAGRSSMSSRVSPSGREGSPIAIFLGFFVFGGGRERLEALSGSLVLLTPEDGGGKDSDDFFEGGGSLDNRDDCGFAGVGEGALSSSLSASLP